MERNRYGLNCKVLTYKDKDEWLRLRKAGIGGSDAGAIAGVNRWKSPISVWLDKVSNETKELDSEYVYWGNVLEEVVANEFKKRHEEFRVQKANAMFISHDRDYAFGDIDRLIIDKETGEKGILEVKTTNAFSSKEWEGDVVPDSYMVQLQWYMYVTGARWGYFACLIGGNKYVEKKVEYDQEVMDIILQKTDEFWNENVLKQIPPSPDGSSDYDEYLKDKYPESIESSIELGEKFVEKLNILDELKDNIKILEKQQKTIEQEIKQEMEENDTAYIGDRKITYKMQIRNSFDSKKFKEVSPEEYEKYIKSSSTRVLKIG